MESRRLDCRICDLSFSTLEEVRLHHLHTHTQIIENRLTHICPSCNTTFSQKRNLVTHWRDIHSNNEEDLGLKCVLCPRRKFPNEQELTHHVQLHHINTESFEDTGFSLEAQAFNGNVKHYFRSLLSWPDNEKSTILTLAHNEELLNDIFKLMYLLLKEGDSGAGRFVLAVKVSYKKYDGQGKVRDELFGIPHSARKFTVTSARFDRARALIQAAFGDVHRAVDAFENVRGSGWSIDTVDFIFVNFSRL